MSLRRGERLDQRYELIEQLGKGGQGTVWRALDRSTGETRAVKVLHVTDHDAFERADREATLLSKVVHPSLLQCHSLVRLPARDMLVLVFDFVESTTLASALSDPRLERTHRLAALRHIADALGHLHAEGIVHRDLKPDNVLLTTDFWEDPASPAALKIIDFGIAAPLAGPEGSTLSGAFGTVPYMAPELLLEPTLEAQRSPSRDVFAFGVMGWEMLEKGHPTGIPANAGAQIFRETYRHFRRAREPWPPRKLEGRWGSVICACLALDATLRPTDGRVLLGLLERGTPAPAPVERAPQERDDRPGDARAVRPETAHGSRARRPRDVTDEHVPATVDSAPPPPVKARTPPPREPTIESAPLASAVVRTAIAPSSSLPSPAPRDRTTPMPPDVGEIAAPVPRASRPEIGGSPSQKKPSDRGARRAAEMPKEASVGWILLVALILAGAVVAATAWLLLDRKERPSTSSPSPSPSFLPPPDPTPSGAPGATAAPSTSATAMPSATATFKICCPSNKDKCSSGRECISEKGCANSQVQGDPEFRVRVFQIEEQSDLYDKRNLAADGKSNNVTVCIGTISAGGSKREACMTVAEIAAPGGARTHTLRVRASDVARAGLRLQLTPPGKEAVVTKLKPTNGLMTKALCQSLSMIDEQERYTVTFYLDDPAPE